MSAHLPPRPGVADEVAAYYSSPAYQAQRARQAKSRWLWRGVVLSPVVFVVLLVAVLIVHYSTP